MDTLFHRNRLVVVFVALGAFVFGLQPALCQSWGQYKQAATTAAAEGNMVDAARFWQSALDLSKDNGPRDPRFCGSVRGLASVFRAEKKFAQAEELYKKVIPDVKAFVPANEELRACGSDYASFLKEQNREAEAEILTKASGGGKVVETLPATTAKSTTESVDSKWNELMSAGKRNLREQDFTSAETAFRSASQIGFSPSDPRINQTYLSLVELYEAQGKIQDAETANQNSLTWILKYRGNGGVDYADALTRHARFLRRLGRAAEATAVDASAKRIRTAIAQKSSLATNFSSVQRDAFKPITSMGAASATTGPVRSTKVPPMASASSYAGGQGLSASGYEQGTAAHSRDQQPPGPPPQAQPPQAPRYLGRCKAILFETTWCKYCKQFDPEFNAASEQFGGLMDFEKVDADKDKLLADQYGVKGYPTLVYLDGAGNVLYNEGHGQFQERVKELTAGSK